MGVDLSQFHQVFIEESIEGLDVMESALMELDPDNIESETINAIFRSAHSIKGGSATFGFTVIAEFTHVLETLLDQIRSGQRGMSAEDVNLFLQSVDCMREMLSMLQDGQNSPTESSLKLQAQFEALLDGEADQTQTDAKSISQIEEEDAEPHRWRIEFTPGEEILRTGNDPLRIFSALAELAHISVSLTDHRLPGFSQFNPEEIFLSWQIIVFGAVSREAILEQFEWVMDDCKIIVSPIEHESKASENAAPEGEQPDLVSTNTAFDIEFTPQPELFQSGNEPSKILQYLREIDPQAVIIANTTKVPALKLLDSEQCFISWQIQMSAGVQEDAIAEAFEWVEDQALVRIQKVVQKLANRNQQDSDVKPEAEIVVESVKDSEVKPSEDKKMASAPAKKTGQSEASSIRVGIDKIDNLINMVGELVITQSMLGQLGIDFDVNKTPKLIEGLSQLEQNTRELQESVMRIRMLPISFAFSRFPRMVRDLGHQLGKKIHLEMQGEQTELDKTVMEKIGDPLVHLVRNAIDHGIESAAERVKTGKSETGKITLNAYHQGGNVVIEINDDGKGLDRDVILKKAYEKGLLNDGEGASYSDEQVFELIFQPGFSTASQVSDVSGRGVGMDVVKRNIQALNGVVEIHSKKFEGSKIRIRLPLTLAILDGQLVRVGANIYIFPLVSIVESMQCRNDLINHIAGSHSVFRLRDDYVPIVRLNKVFGTVSDFEELDQALMVVVESDGEKIGVVVDELLAQQQVVIKSLEQNYRRIEGVSGATILGDGTVALIVDIPGVVKLAGAESAKNVFQANLAGVQALEKIRKMA